MKIVRTTEIPDVFQGVDPIDIGSDAVGFYGYAVEAQEGENPAQYHGVLLFIPFVTIEDVKGNGPEPEGI